LEKSKPGSLLTLSDAFDLQTTPPAFNLKLAVIFCADSHRKRALISSKHHHSIQHGSGKKVKGFAAEKLVSVNIPTFS
jgi:hypothetical protein